MTALWELALTGGGNGISLFFIRKLLADNRLVRLRAPGAGLDKHRLQIFQAAQDAVSPPGDRDMTHVLQLMKTQG